MTQPPKQAATRISTLSRLAVDSQHDLMVTALRQKKTATGLVTITASLSGEMPMSLMPQLNQLVENHTKSGQRLVITQLQPYITTSQRLAVDKSLSTQLYQQAQSFMTILNQQDKKRKYQISVINFHPQRSSQPRQLMLATASTPSNNRPLSIQQAVVMSADVLFVTMPHKP